MTTSLAMPSASDAPRSAGTVTSSCVGLGEAVGSGVGLGVGCGPVETR